MNSSFRKWQFAARSLRSALLYGALCLLVAGCSTNTAVAPCYTLKCMKADAARSVMRQCVADLFRHDRLPRKEKRRINETYHYPYTNMQTFMSLSSYGAVSPSPKDWCSDYGQRYTALRFAGSS